MELLLHQWGDWPELYRNTDKTEATEIVIIDSQMNYRGKLDTYDSFELYFAKIVITCIILIKRQFQVKLNQAVSYIMAM